MYPIFTNVSGTVIILFGHQPSAAAEKNTKLPLSYLHLEMNKTVLCAVTQHVLRCRWKLYIYIHVHVCEIFRY